MSVTDADRALVADIIDAYHTTRLNPDYVSHILGKASVRKAFAAHRTRAHTEGYEAAVRDVVAWLRENAEWHDRHDDGLSGFDHIAQGCRDAAEIIGEFKP